LVNRKPKAFPEGRTLSNAGANLRATIAYTVANATAGRARVRLMYTVDGRTSEVQVS
jgi:hypothetical protein